MEILLITQDQFYEAVNRWVKDLPPMGSTNRKDFQEGLWKEIKNVVKVAIEEPKKK